MFTFCIVLLSTTNPPTAYITPGGTTLAVGASVVNSQNLSMSCSYILANVSGTIGLTINYFGGSGVGINASTSFFQAVRIG